MKKILLADDHAPTREVFTRILETENYRIIQAADGKQALAKAASEKPDLIIMDVMMPNMDGYETLAKLKEDPSTQGIKVMMLTAMDRPRERAWALEMGADSYMVKPVRIEEFQTNVKRAVARSRRPVIRSRA